jgi:hypothetical protein
MASAISTSSSSSSSDSDWDVDSSLSDELPFLSFFTPGSGSEDSSESDSLEPSLGAFAGIRLFATFFVGAETSVVTFLVGASSEAEDSSSDDSSEDSSLDSSLAAPFAAALEEDALVGAAFPGAALAVFDGFSSESSLSSLSLSLTGFAEAFGGGLAANFEGSSESLPLDSSSDSLSLDSEEGLAFGGGALD